VSGALVLGACFLIFAPVYLLSANYFGIIDEDDKAVVGGRWSAITKFFKAKSEKPTDHRPTLRATDH